MLCVSVEISVVSKGIGISVKVKAITRALLYILKPSTTAWFLAIAFSANSVCIYVSVWPPSRLSIATEMRP